MAVKNVVLDPAFGNNLSGQPAIDVIFKYTVDNSLDNDSIPYDRVQRTHFLNLGNRKPYYKDTTGDVFEDQSFRAIEDAAKWNYQNSKELSFGDIYAAVVPLNC